MEIYSFEVRTLQGETTDLSRFRGQVMLIVNTASLCGFTPQFAELQQLHTRYAARGFSVLGFPCNQFRKQDPATNEEIGRFCTQNYGVTFPMFEKIEVNGERTHPLFRHLKGEAPGVFGTNQIKWNFTKFLIARNGQVVERFSPRKPPLTIASAIERLLNGP